MEYKLNTEFARKTDAANSSITEKGKYFGRFARAEAVQSKKGTKGVDFSFVSNNGETANYLTLWTQKENGEFLYGYNILMAIMTCLRVKEIRTEDGEVAKYDPEAGQMRKQWVPLFKDLMDKPVGLLLYMEEYLNGNNESRWKPAIAAPCDENGFVATEILNKATKPERLEAMLKMLRDRPLKRAAGAPKESTAPSSPSEPFGDMDDDLPF